MSPRRKFPLSLPSLVFSCPQRLYYVREAHGIVVTDVAFLPEKGRGPELLGSHETALFSVAVDSRCQLHLLPSRRESLGQGIPPLTFRCSKNWPLENGLFIYSHPSAASNEIG
jgi:hypothetical protein